MEGSIYAAATATATAALNATTTAAAAAAAVAATAAATANEFCMQSVIAQQQTERRQGAQTLLAATAVLRLQKPLRTSVPFFALTCRSRNCAWNRPDRTGRFL
eukprot:18013-Heterococcus_DN1.PRE.1